MNLRVIFSSLIICFFFCQCSPNSSKTSQNDVPIEVVEEIQQLDSLNQQIEKNMLEIENSIQSVESALSELSNLE